MDTNILETAKWFSTMCAVLLLLSLHTTVDAAEYGNLTLLPQVGVSTGYNGGEVPDKDDLPAAEVDVLHTYQHSWFRSIVELRVNTDRGSRLERLQLGARLPKNTYIWFGKFHSLSDYWLENYHEGAYLSPSITTPFSSSAGYEGGLTSSHQSGVKIEHSSAIGEGQIDLKATVGLSVPFSDLDTSPAVSDFYTDYDRDNLTYAAKIAYLPQAYENTEFGLTYAQGESGLNRSELESAFGPFAAPFFQNIRLGLDLVNAYVNYEQDNFRILGSWTGLAVDVADGDEDITALFGPGGDRDIDVDFSYIFASYNLKDNLNIYGRYEKLKTDEVSLLFQPLFQGINFDLKYSKKILGAKYEFAKRQTITLELTDQESFGISRNSAHITWAAAFDWDL